MYDEFKQLAFIQDSIAFPSNFRIHPEIDIQLRMRCMSNDTLTEEMKWQYSTVQVSKLTWVGRGHVA